MYISSQLKPRTIRQRSTDVHDKQTRCGPEFILSRFNSELSFSVIGSFHKPASAEQVMDEAIENKVGGALNSDIPFITSPWFLLPPVTGRAPGTSLPEDVTIGDIIVVTDDAGGNAVAHSDHRLMRGVEQA